MVWGGLRAGAAGGAGLWLGAALCRGVGRAGLPAPGAGPGRNTGETRRLLGRPRGLPRGRHGLLGDCLFPGGGGPTSPGRTGRPCCPRWRRATGSSTTSRRTATPPRGSWSGRPKTSPPLSTTARATSSIAGNWTHKIHKKLAWKEILLCFFGKSAILLVE